MKSGFIALSFVVALSGCKNVNNDSGTKLIGGGEDYSLFPTAVGLMMQDGSKKTLGACTGTIVRDDLVMTAAHCIKDQDAALVQIFDQQDGPLAAKNLVSSSFVVFPAYDKKIGPIFSINADIAFLVFPKGTFSGMKPAAIAGQSASTGDSVKLVGYGQTGFRETPSHLQLKRFSGANKVADMKTQLAGAIVLETAVVGLTTAGIEAGDSGGPLFNTAGEVVGLAHANAMDNDAVPIHPANKTNDKTNQEYSLYVNLKDAGISSFISTVMHESNPGAGTGQTAKATIIAGTPPTLSATAAGSTDATAANGKPYCKNNGGQGYGSAFDCGSGLTCKKDDNVGYADSSTCVVGSGSATSTTTTTSSDTSSNATGTFLSCPKNKYCDGKWGWLLKGEGGCTATVTGYKSDLGGCSCTCN